MPLNYMETGSLLLSKVSVNRLYFLADCPASSAYAEEAVFCCIMPKIMV